MSSALARFSGELAALAKQVRPSVVKVLARQGTTHKVGAGVAVAPGLVVTCRHVLMPGWQLVIDAGHGEVAVTMIAEDADNDLALLRTAAVLPVLQLADDVAVGAVVVVIGTPGGRAGFTTMGTVARCGGYVRIENGGALSDIIEIDARVAPGNSGGAVVDISGQLVGIAAAAIPALDYGVAVPVAQVAALLGQVPVVAKNGDDWSVVRSVFAQAKAGKVG